jgi:WhiB family transcriptional regulator, redox-sensing transcriptional regulator
VKKYVRIATQYIYTGLSDSSHAVVCCGRAARHDMGGANVPVMIDMPRMLATPPCLDDADRWVDGGDDPELKVLCRACPRRWHCAREALETPGAQGMWSGVNIPEHGRGRVFAMRQLRSLAAHGGLWPRR